jgi:hypothetical protein
MRSLNLAAPIGNTRNSLGLDTIETLIFMRLGHLYTP